MKKSHLLSLFVGLGLLATSCTGLGMGVTTGTGTSYNSGYNSYSNYYPYGYHAVPVWAWGNPYYDYPTHVVLVPTHHHHHHHHYYQPTYQPTVPNYPVPLNPGVGPVVGGSASANPIIPSHRLPLNPGVGPVVIPIQARETSNGGDNSSIVPPQPLPLNRGVGLQVPNGK